MLYILFGTVVSEEEAAKLTNRKLVENTDMEFDTMTQRIDLNEDEFFKKCVEEVEQCDIPMRNVIRDLLTEDTHSFDRVSSGTKALWLMHYCNDKYLMPTAYFGPNCYRLMVESSKDRDIYLYDNADMMVNEEADAECVGEFTDFHTGTVVQFGENRAWDYIGEMGY